MAWKISIASNKEVKSSAVTAKPWVPAETDYYQPYPFAFATQERRAEAKYLAALVEKEREGTLSIEEIEHLKAESERLEAIVAGVEVSGSELVGGPLNRVNLTFERGVAMLEKAVDDLQAKAASGDLSPEELTANQIATDLISSFARGVAEKDTAARVEDDELETPGITPAPGEFSPVIGVARGREV